MRNKKLGAPDRKSPRGQDLVKKLVANCDIVVENFRPKTLERWGLGYEDRKASKPRIIMVRVTGFGQDGPYSSRPGYGIIGEALSGLRGLIGDPDRPPSRAAIPLTDYIAGLYGAFGAAMAVAYRCATGKGQCIDTALYEAAFSFTESTVPAYERLGTVAKRAGARLPGHTPNNLYETRDGEHIHIAAANQSLFRRLAVLMERSDLPQIGR